MSEAKTTLESKIVDALTRLWNVPDRIEAATAARMFASNLSAGDLHGAARELLKLLDKIEF
jgi:hypothetical protein